MLYNTKQQNVEHINTLKMHEATLLNVMNFFVVVTQNRYTKVIKAVYNILITIQEILVCISRY